MLVTPKCSLRTVNPATVVANQRKGCNRENAGRSICSAFHHKTHNGIGTPICSCRVIIHSIAYVSYTVNNYTATTDRGSDAVVGLVVERAANAAAGVLPITAFPLVCDDSGRIYGA